MACSVDDKVREYIRCSACNNQMGGCEGTCARYNAYKNAYNKAINIIKDPTIGVPRSSDCKECSDRALGCHSMCSKYLEFVAYRDITKENRRKELLKSTVEHLPGVPGVPSGVNYRKHKYNNRIWFSINR